MCRQLSEGGRRCRCDTSRKRKMRRITAALRATLPVDGDDSLSTSKKYGKQQRRAAVTMDSVRAAHALALHDIHDDADTAYDSIMSLGAQIDELASKYTKGFSVPLATWEKAFSEDTQQEVVEAVARIREISESLLELRAEGELASDLADALRTERALLYRNSVRRHVGAMQTARTRVARKLAAARLDIISELRPMGGSLENVATTGNHRAAINTVNTALAHFPTAWIDASNSHGDTLRVRVGNGRGSYSHGSREVLDGSSQRREEGAQIVLNDPETRAGVALAIHEFSHRVQATSPQVAHFEEQHVAQRRTPYADAYMKQGSHMMREMLPCAITGVTTTAHGSLMGFSGYSEDEESRHFALGVLASA